MNLTTKQKQFIRLNSNRPASMIAKDLGIDDKKIVEDYQKESRKRNVFDIMCPITGHKLIHNKKVKELN